MKMHSAVLIGFLVSAAHGINSLTDLVPEKLKFWCYAAAMLLGLAIQVIAHLSNPDGTSANLPHGLTPEELERYRKMFAKGALVLLLCLLPATIANGADGIQEKAQLVGSGSGFDPHAVSRWSTWYVVAKKISPATYATVAADFDAGHSSTRAGFETIIIRLGGILITAKGDAGVLTSVTNAGSAFSGGGSMLFPVARLTKIPDSYVIGSVTMLKSAVGGSAVRPVYRIGFGAGF